MHYPHDVARRVARLGATALLLALASVPAQAQTALWYEVAVGGAGARLTCGICTPDRDVGASISGAVGAYAGKRVRVGLEYSRWSYRDVGVREQSQGLGLVAHLVPNPARGLYLLGGLGIFGLALASARSTTALRQLRWIVWGAAIGSGPFLRVYAVPFAFGATPSLAMQLTAIPLGLVPLAFASAIVRYLLMDVEVILKRLLVYTAAVSAIAAIYLVILGTTDLYFVSSEDDHRWVIAALATPTNVPATLHTA